MSAFQSIAFVSYSATNKALLRLFLAQSADQFIYRILTRVGKALDPELEALKAKGISIHAVDYNSPESLEAALNGAEVVISGLRDEGLDVQPAVARAAKNVGVRLFVPSEFGKDTRGETSAYLRLKAELHTLLKELSLPYTLYFTGFWPDTVNVLSGPMGLDFIHGKFLISGDGTGKSSFTDPESFIPFVHWSLTTIPLAELEWRIFELEAERKSILDLIADWQAKYPNKKAEIHHRTPEEEVKYRQAIDAVPPFDFMSLELTRGTALNSPNGFQIWPEWGPIVKVIDRIITTE